MACRQLQLTAKYIPFSANQSSCTSKLFIRVGIKRMTSLCHLLVGLLSSLCLPYNERGKDVTSYFVQSVEKLLYVPARRFIGQWPYSFSDYLGMWILIHNIVNAFLRPLASYNCNVLSHFYVTLLYAAP